MLDPPKEPASVSFNWVYAAMATILAVWVVWVSSTISPMENRVAEIIKSQEAITTIRNSYLNEKLSETRIEIERLKKNDEILFDRLSRVERDDGKH